MKQEYKELKQEETDLYNELENVFYINHFSKEEKKEFNNWLTRLIDNQINMEKHCNN